MIIQLNLPSIPNGGKTKQKELSIVAVSNLVKTCIL
jgi:hypothetical protein